MRDYNAIQFRSPSDKQKQAVGSPQYSPGLISTVRSTSLSPIPRVSQPRNTSSSNNNNNSNKNTSNQSQSKTTASDHTQQQPNGRMIGSSSYSGVTSTTVASSSTSAAELRLPYLPNTGDAASALPLEAPPPPQSSSVASTNVRHNTTSSAIPNNNTPSSPQRPSNNHKSYRSSSAAENVMSLSPTPYNQNGKSNSNNGIHLQQQQQQQRTNAVVSSTPTTLPNGVNGTSTASVTSAASSALLLSPTDALALRRDYNNNFELYIQKLRTEIEQQQLTIHKISSAASKSDAVILELRSTIRQYKRQLEKYQQQQQTVDTSVVVTEREGATNQNADTSLLSGTTSAPDTNPLPPPTTTTLSDKAIENHPLVIELTDQLHDYHNKLMTADLIRKELEDTIEAEQYTWELRVQDLEREVQELKQTPPPRSSTATAPPHTSRSADRDNNNDDDDDNDQVESNAFRKQLEDAQSEIQRYRSIIMTTTTASDVDDVNHNSSMNTDVSSSNNNNILMWKEKVSLLEQERMELQGCLDEALKELEAVDLELQQEDANNALREENERLQNIIQQLQPSAPPQRGLMDLPDKGPNQNDTAAVMEQLQHLYRWLLERDGSEERLPAIRTKPQQYRTVEELIHAIQEHIDQHCTSINHVEELERQISVHQGDIHAKEEETTEIRNSLKEAVSLLRPIQDSLAKLEKEKGKYLESLEGLQSQHDANLLEIRKYKQLINDKDDEIDQMKQNIESLEIQLSKAKLAVANTVVAQHNLGNSSTSRSVMMMDLNNSNDISSPSDTLDEKRAKRRTGENNLKELLRDAQLRGDTGGDASEREQQLRTIQEYELEISALREELAKNDVTMQSLQSNLTRAKEEWLALTQHVNAESGTDQPTNKAQLQQAELRVQQLEDELHDTKRALASKRDAERSLNKSLKDALGLIKPLQIHLEESEMEKRHIAQELELLMKQQQQQQIQRHTIKSLSPSQLDRSAGGHEISNAVSVEVVKELETTVQQLEKENAMLQDALEDMSQSLNASHISGAASPNHKILSSKQYPSTNMNTAGTGSSINNNNESTRWHQEFVELQSRYEVTQTRLKDAYHENHALSEMVQQEQDEKYQLHDEVTTLREQLVLRQMPPGGGNMTQSSSVSIQ